MAYLKHGTCILLFLILGITSSTAFAQRGITYEQLANQQREQSLFIDSFTLPGSTPEMVRYVTTFRIDYNMLPFRKFDDGSEEQKFFSPLGMNIEIFKDPNAPQEKKRRRDDFSVEGLEAVDRSAWRDTAFAENYEQTKSKNKFITGHLISELVPGPYSYVLQFTRGEDVDGQMSRRRTVKIDPYDEKKSGHIINIESVQSSSGSDRPRSLQLMNFGENVYYGKDFYTLIHLPNYQSSDTYNFNVSRVDIGSRDTTRQNSVHSGSITADKIYENTSPQLLADQPALRIQLNDASEGPTYALLNIPNSQFINAVYQIRVTKEGQKPPVAQSIFRSRWIEMPTSLLNVDVAINMLRFIVDEKTIQQMSSGSNAEKEKNFREFWDKRDPTPKTEFNELMAEYYRRVDYSYEEFSTLNVSGFNTDQGRVYIRFGPPENIDRRFPPGEPAVEVWKYPDRSFVFRAVSGFGEFKLVSD